MLSRTHQHTTFFLLQKLHFPSRHLLLTYYYNTVAIDIVPVNADNPIPTHYFLFFWSRMCVSNTVSTVGTRMCNGRLALPRPRASHGYLLARVQITRDFRKASRPAAGGKKLERRDQYRRPRSQHSSCHVLFASLHFIRQSRLSY
jgi:hypothetical protein